MVKRSFNEKQTRVFDSPRRSIKLTSSPLKCTLVNHIAERFQPTISVAHQSWNINAGHDRCYENKPRQYYTERECTIWVHKVDTCSSWEFEVVVVVLFTGMLGSVSQTLSFLLLLIKFLIQKFVSTRPFQSWLSRREWPVIRRLPVGGEERVVHGGGRWARRSGGVRGEWGPPPHDHMTTDITSCGGVADGAAHRLGSRDGAAPSLPLTQAVAELLVIHRKSLIGLGLTVVSTQEDLVLLSQLPVRSPRHKLQWDKH